MTTVWHNFHAHNQRWKVGDETIDTRSLGPAESFVADTIVPPVILLPLEDDHDNEHEAETRRVRLRGDFLVHCHVEMHMMEGMAALVRAIQEVEITDELENKLGFRLPIDQGHEVDHGRAVPDALHHRGGRRGTWERLPDSPIFIVHAALMHTGKVLLFSGTAETGFPLESRVWDPSTGTMTTQTFGEDLFCSGHAFLADGRLCVAGGSSTPGTGIPSTHLFDPVAETWTKVASMSQPRWYPTVLTLRDGRILAVSGRGAIIQEIYDPVTDSWQTLLGADRDFPELYPSLHLLASGEIFYSRAGWAQADRVQTQTGYLEITGPTAGLWTNMGQQRFYDRQEGTAVIQIDTTTSPPSAQIMVIGGGVFGAATAKNAQSCEVINVTQLAPPPVWTRTADMNFPRTNVNAVLLPDGTIFVVGSQRNGKWNPDPQHVFEAEVYDPRTNTWTPTAPMEHPRQYHSIAVLLPDGRVLTAGGVDPSPGVAERDQRSMEVFSPPYLSRAPRPAITASPANVAYGVAFDVTTPDAAQIDSVVFLRPCAMTHHTDPGQRYIKLAISSRDPGRLRAQAPANSNVAPPGYYMLFVLNANGVPSVAQFIRLS